MRGAAPRRPPRPRPCALPFTLTLRRQLRRCDAPQPQQRPRPLLRKLSADMGPMPEPEPSPPAEEPPPPALSGDVIAAVSRAVAFADERGGRHRDRYRAALEGCWELQTEDGMRVVTKTMALVRYAGRGSPTGSGGTGGGSDADLVDLVEVAGRAPSPPAPPLPRGALRSISSKMRVVKRFVRVRRAPPRAAG
eukprot:gene31822-12847_t